MLAVLGIQVVLNLTNQRSHFVPPDETLATLQTMDTLRARWGSCYPRESGA